VAYVLSNKMKIISNLDDRAIVAERCEIRPRLLLITNKMWHFGYQMT